jgi:hypothetical protein
MTAGQKMVYRLIGQHLDTSKAYSRQSLNQLRLVASEVSVRRNIMISQH